MVRNPICQQSVRLQQEKDELQAELEATTNLHEQLDLTEQIKDAQSEAAKKKKEADDAEAARVQELNSFYQGVADTIQSGIVNGIMGAIDGSKSLKESLSGLLKQVGGMFLNQAIGSFMPKFGAEGLYVNGPTNAVIGEGSVISISIVSIHPFSSVKTTE